MAIIRLKYQGLVVSTSKKPKASEEEGFNGAVREDFLPGASPCSKAGLIRILTSTGNYTYRRVGVESNTLLPCFSPLSCLDSRLLDYAIYGIHGKSSLSVPGLCASHL